jgi:hypothetical protein
MGIINYWDWYNQNKEINWDKQKYYIGDIVYYQKKLYQVVGLNHGNTSRYLGLGQYIISPYFIPDAVLDLKSTKQHNIHLGSKNCKKLLLQPMWKIIFKIKEMLI